MQETTQLDLYSKTCIQSTQGFFFFSFETKQPGKTSITAEIPSAVFFTSNDKLLLLYLLYLADLGSKPECKLNELLN